MAALLLLAAGVGTATPARAQAFPNKPLTLVVPYAPGGTGDILGRVMATEMAKVLGQPVVIENRAGAGGNLGADLVARNARPDGYTLLFTATSLASNVSLMKKMPFDPLKDLAAVAGPITMQNLVVVPAGSDIKDLRELIARARAQPGQLSYGSSGHGTSNHLATALFEVQAGLDLLHVPYKSAGEAMPALIGGQVRLMIDLMPSAIAQVKGGKLRALAVTGAQRSPALPEVPTVAEAGVPGYEFSAWFGLFAPAATPREVIAVLNAAAQKAAVAPEFQARLAQLGAEGGGGTPESFAAYFRGEVDKWARVVKSGRLPAMD